MRSTLVITIAVSLGTLAGVAIADPEVTTTYPSGAMRERAAMLNGKRDGIYEKWAPNCQILIRGHFKKGMKDGDWAEWNEKARKREEGQYTQNEKTGTWTHYNPEGGKETSGPYVHGVAEGQFTEWFMTGGEWRKFEMKAGERTAPEAVACKAKGGIWAVDYEKAEEGCKIGGAQVGVWTAYYPTGKVKSKFHYEAGEQDGLGQEFHPTGEVLHQGMWKAGLPDGKHEWRSTTNVLYGSSTITNGSGVWKTYLPDGKLSLDAKYKDGIPDGVWTAYYDNAAPWEQVTYVSGTATGSYKRWYKTGELAVAGNQVNGLRVGGWVAYYQNGKIQWSGPYSDEGMRVGVWSVFAWSGQLAQMGDMIDDKQSGNWIELHDNGHVKGLGPMQFGVKNGHWQEFWADGSFWRDVEYTGGMEAGPAPMTCARLSGNWFGDPEKRMLGCQVCRAKPDDSIDKIETGVWTWWHPNGGIEKRGGLDNGKQVGHWEFFFDNSALMLEGEFVDGKEQGDWKGYYRTGKPRFEGAYKDGQPTGEWTSWQEAGAVLSKGSYEAGKRKGTWHYYNAAGGVETVTY